MTPRERVLAALNFQETDRVPVDLSGHRSSGISAMAYARLRDHLGLARRPIRVYDPVQQLAIVDDDVLDRFRIDTIELGRAFALEDADWREWELPDGTPCLMPVWALPETEGPDWVIRAGSGQISGRMPAGVIYFEQEHYPFQECDDLDRLEEVLAENLWSLAAPPPGPKGWAGRPSVETLGQKASRLRQKTDRAILGLFGGNLLETGQMLYRNDVFLMLLAGEPQRAHAFLDRLMALHLANLDCFLETFAAHLDIIVFGDDLGMQTGPQISPRMYQEFFQPRQRILWQRVKERSTLKIMLHCCGGVQPLLSGLIEAGLEAINPVQINCRGMDPAGLKRDFGNRLCFWGGGCDTQEILINGTPVEVREHAQRLLDIWRPGGGYVFQQVHNIMADVPPANVEALLDAVNPS